jgi:pimeloyl-ACP methyl ester carboxylesterase
MAGVRSPYVMVGASIGALYVQGYQRRYPNEVVGLVLDDPAGEEGAKYLVNGKDMPIYEMTGADMRAAFKPLFTNPPHYDQPTKIESLTIDCRRAYNRFAYGHGKSFLLRWMSSMI